MEPEEEPVERQRKSLAIDKDTYDLLREICAKERRSLIHQLQHLIEAKQQELFYKDYL